MVPVAYTPNNDLYVSADQGGFEITNVHPVSDLYTELVIRGSWSGTGKSLLSIQVASGPRIIGINKFYEWPDFDSVNHSEITEDVRIFFERDDINAEVTVTDSNGTTNTYQAVNGIVTIPSTVLVNSISRKVTLQLFIDGVTKSKIVSLPAEESEDFPAIGGLLNDGEVGTAEHLLITDFIDVQFVDDIVYTGLLYSNSYNAICAYDENRNFVKIILSKTGDSPETRHFVPDGSYKYIRASAHKNYDHSLTVHYVNRNRR